LDQERRAVIHGDLINPGRGEGHRARDVAAARHVLEAPAVERGQRARIDDDNVGTLS
jgi:hypothetical protein